MQREVERSENGQAGSLNRRRKGLYILVVEDHEDTAETTAMLLRLYGHEVQIAADGPAALQAAQDRCPDVALVDIRLPGMDGYEVARKLAEQPAERRPLMIAVTGLMAENDPRLADPCIDLHLLKPLDPAMLERLLNRFHKIIR